MLSDAQRRLLAVCCIPLLNWHLIARQAQRPGGLDGLLRGEVHEESKDSRRWHTALTEGLEALPRLLEEAEEKSGPGFSAGARLVTVLDEGYPANLRLIFNPPPFLFYLGDFDPYDVRAVAVVGTRRATPEGVRRAKKLAVLLTEHEVTVLSGLAEGIDTAAHEATLDAGGRTAAVMGTGICRVFPRENAELARRISRKGTLFSQFWPMTPPATYTFPRRNVTMSGLSQGTAVIEASATSGAKMQARLALEHGKKVFLLKSLIDSYPWAQKYVERGAIPVSGDVEVILNRLQDPRAVRSLANRHKQLRLNL